MTEPAVSTVGLTKTYGKIEALRGIDFEIAFGEVFALLGPNGAGKTTTVEILEGYRRPDAGSVSVLGVEPFLGGASHRARIGIVLQESAVQRELTVREAVEMYAGYYPEPLDPAEAISTVGLGERTDQKTGRLSGGEKRRLDLALAIVGNPDLLFLDEPTAGFDPEARRNAWELIRQFAADGKSVVMTTHYMEEAASLAHRIAVLVNGKIVASGPPAEIGGRRTRQTRITLPASLANPPVVAAERRSLPDGRTLLLTEDPTRSLHAISDWAASNRLNLDGIEVQRPSLEDVYFELVTAAEDA